MRKNIVAGNWKMNKTLQQGIELADEIKNLLTGQKLRCEVVIATPFIHLASVSEVVKGSVIGLAAENCADRFSGAFTGEVSAEMIKSTGATYCIIGHSERRTYYGENFEILKNKVLLALENDLKPIFCIGEYLEERKKNIQNEVVGKQLDGSVFNLAAEDFAKIILAYEPVWAIGTGLTATSEQAQQMHAFIRSLIAEKYGKEIAENTSILYGGSCNPANAAELFSKPDVDGGLIGGASLKAGDFKTIIDAF
ncbi:MAG: triose-phosphate isomerase [Prevotellaceae bacterium]|jgi:triosephosphate isomerase|nr:triose-phosphate isomerase [Prevotellaceae bacterium]